MNTIFSKTNLIVIFIAIGAVYIFGMLVDIMDVDAAQYAHISRQMLDTKGFLIIKDRYNDYLDKPPLLFWLSSFSFWIFGVSNWAYKLPSVLIAVVGIYSTYRFTKLYYNENTSILAALILATTQALFLTTNDVRTDTILYSSIIFSVWNLCEYLKNNKALHFILGFLGLSFAMLAKGPVGLMVPVLGIGTHLLFKKEYKFLFKWQWLLGLLIIALLLTPMCIGLYQQFGTKGLQFYFWEQSFGRITGSNTAWKNEGGYFFMFHSFLWSFLPWSLFFIVAFGVAVYQLIRSRFTLSPDAELITMASVLLPYLILSRSQYQLPHYIYPVLPFAAIITANFINDTLPQYSKYFKTVFIIQLTVCICLWIIGGLLLYICFQGQPWTFVLFSIACGIFLKSVFRKGYFILDKIILSSIITILGVNLLLSLHVYPEILKYQSSKFFATELQKRNVDEQHFFAMENYAGFALDFYSGFRIREINFDDFNKYMVTGEKYYLTVTRDGLEKIRQSGIEPVIEYSTVHYHVSKLSLPFLNPNTRDSRLEQRYLISFVR